MLPHKAATENPPQAPSASTAASGVRSTRIRYRILGLSFFVGLIMYLDRGCWGAAAPSIMRDFGLNKITMGWIASVFNWTYGLFQIPGGWLADRFGSRLVLSAAITWWSIFTAVTGAAFSAGSFAVIRGLFGAGESAAWPSASRALLRWLPGHQRAFGQGFQHSGSRLGGALAPAIAVFLIARWNWRVMFFVFGVAGIVVAAAWHRYYRDFPQDHPGVNRGELRLLDSAVPARHGNRAAVPWRRILRSRNLLFLSLMYFCYGWVFWLYLTWLPTYLSEARHLSQEMMGIAASVPLLAATATNMAGGWLADRLACLWGNLCHRGRRNAAGRAGSQRGDQPGLSHRRVGGPGTHSGCFVGVVPGHRRRTFGFGHRSDEHVGQPGRRCSCGDGWLPGD
jgi:sugar phosphate permease